MLTRDQLCGWSYEKAMTMGLPHAGARYTGKTPKCYTATSQCCAVCGKRAGSVHHVVPRRNGLVFTFDTPNGSYDLKSPLFALCGSGTTGCHGLFHDGTLKARWIWEPSFSLAWESGALLKTYGAHSPKLYRFGHWEVTRDGEVIAEIWR